MDFVACYVDSSGSVLGQIEMRKVVIEALLDRGIRIEDMFSFGSSVHDDVHHIDGGGTLVHESRAHADQKFGARCPILIVVDDGRAIFSPFDNQSTVITTFEKVLGRDHA